MAAYTSIKSGDWDDPTVWGTASYPSVAGDTAAIGHTVDYNVVSTIELGAITIDSGGLLKFKADLTTKLTLGDVDLRINSSGELRVGAVDAVIGKAFIADLIWNTTGDNLKGIYVASGGKLTMYGDPDYYGAVDNSVLAANWTAGKIFSMVGDFATKWAVGDQITVHKGAQYISYSADTILCTIASLTLNGSNTDITINEAAPGVTFATGGRVQNVSRNVRLSKLGASTVIGNYNTLRPRIYDMNVVANNNCVMSNALLTGFYGIESLFNFRFLRSIIRNTFRGINSGSGHTISGAVYSNSNGINSGSGHTISGAVYSNSIGIYSGSGHTISGAVYSNSNGIYYGSGHTISGAVYSNSNGINSGSGHTISGAVYSNSVGINSGSGHTISGAVYSNSVGINSGSGHTISGAVYSNSGGINSGSGLWITGRLGYDAAGTVALNTFDIGFMSSVTAVEIYLQGAKIPPAGLVFRYRNDVLYSGNVYSEDHGQVLGEHIHYAQFGTCTRDVSVVRPGGAGSSIKIEPLSLCAVATPIRLYTDPMPGPLFKFWLVAGVQRILNVYIRSLGVWASYPTAGELYIQASYLSDPATIARSLLNSTAVMSDATTWVPFSVTLTPARAGWVDVYLYMRKYEAGKGCYVDIKPVVT